MHAKRLKWAGQLLGYSSKRIPERILEKKWFRRKKAHWKAEVKMSE